MAIIKSIIWFLLINALVYFALRPLITHPWLQQHFILILPLALMPFLLASLVAMHQKILRATEFDAEQKKLTLVHQQNNLQESLQQLRVVFASMAEGVMVLDLDHKIVLANPALKQILQVDHDLVGRSVLEVLRHNTFIVALEKVLASSSDHATDLLVAQINGESRELQVHAQPLIQEERVVGAVAVFSDVTELKRLENIRREFVANISHEFKTPLTNILGYAETLEQDLQDEIPKRFIKKIFDNAKNLQALVEDVLSLSAVEAGHIKVELVMLDLAAFIENILREQQSKAAQKNIELKADITTQVSLGSDPRLLKQILDNLIDNAIKYTSEGGSVAVRLTENETKTQIAVIDNGSGIPKEDLPRVFERFFRVDRAHSKLQPGTGLGLAIVKHLVAELGGTVSVQSELGRGSVFTLSL